MKKTHFFGSQLQVYGYPCNPLAIVVTWVPIMGVYNQFLGASGPIKKKRLNFAMFKFSFFTVTLPKMVDSAQNQSHPTHLSNLILIPNFSSLGLQMAEKIINMYFFGGQIHFLIFLDFSLLFCPIFSNFLPF